MCGIVGYLGNKNAVDVVVEGLERLEYRGYDSSGVAIPDSANKSFAYRKKVGKLENLKVSLEEKPMHSHLAIGHTRWATHGKVNEPNAHPHVTDQFVLVHNGIVENSASLREELLSSGSMFSSETDTEVFVALLQKYYNENQSVLKSISESFAKICGNSAFVFLSKGEDALYCVRRAAPLICGISSTTGELMASSDPYALVGFVDKLYFPEDEVVCILRNNDDGPSIAFYEFDGTESKRYEEKMQYLKIESNDLGAFDHFMLKEIHEQPELLLKLTDSVLKGSQKDIFDNIVAKEKFEHLYIIACGTAWHAGLVIKDILERCNKIPCSVELASEFRYKENFFKDGDGAVFISQSGETADTLAAQEICLQKKIPIVSILNVENSTLYRNSNYNLCLEAGYEIGVASTKAFTQMVLAGFLWSRNMSGQLSHNNTRKEVETLSSRFSEVLRDFETIKGIAEELYNKKGFIYTGRREHYPIALEGALKLKEIAYVHAEGYAAGELKHGPIALIDEDMVNVAIVSPELYEKTVSNVEEVKARRGIIFIVGPRNDKALMELSDFYYGIDYEGLPNLSPLLSNLILQLFSYYFALFKGTDIDKPRNLAKSVTVE